MDLILIHGALGAASQLSPLATLFEQQGRKTHLIELEGHGGTPSPAAANGAYDMRRFVANVRDYMDASRIERAALFGYSMGGYVALLLAAESPERVTSLATLATKLAWTPEVAAKEAKRLDAATIRAKVPAFAQQLEERHAGAGGWESVLAKTAALMTSLGARPPVDDALLARIAQPARLMVGDRDAIVSVDETARAARVMPKGAHAVLPGTPHPFEQSDPALVASTLRDFAG